MADQDDIHTIRRRQARSGKVSYGDAIVLRESSKFRTHLVPFFVPRSHGTELQQGLTGSGLLP